MIIAIAVTSVAALFTLTDTETFTAQSLDLGQPLQTVEAAKGVNHLIEMEAVAMPDGMYAYRMVSYIVENDNKNDDDKERDLIEEGVYTQKPSIPGPTIVLTEGDHAVIKLKNNACDSTFLEGNVGASEIFNVGMHVHGVHYDISDDATYQRVNMDNTSGASCGATVEYEWDAGLGTQGTWPYHDHTFFQNEVGAEDVGLFGTLIVNPAKGKVDGLVDSNSGKIKKVDVDDIEKEFVLWMVSSEVLGRSVFYGMEIDNGNGGKQTPLWVNPNLYATEGDNVRYHVLGLGDETHAFHLHGHRWVEADGGSADIIDVKEITPLQRHTFLITASDNENDIDGPEGWMYHCHFFNHMQQGMSGMMMVLPAEDKIDEMPDIGATFTLSDEPGLWMKTLDAGVLDDLDEFVESSLGLPLQAVSKPGTGFAPNWLGLVSEHGLVETVGSFMNTEGRSLAILSSDNPSTVLWTMKDSQTKHTITNLIWPAGAEILTVDGTTEPLGSMDADLSVRGSTYLTDSMGRPAMLKDPGLYVFVCKIHPYMFSGVLVDDPGTKLENVELLPEFLPGATTDVPILDLSPETTILTRSIAADSSGDLIFDGPDELPDYLSTLPSLDPITTGLVATFYVATDPNNWRDYNEDDWIVSLPPVPVTDNTEICETVGEGEDAVETCELNVVFLSILDSSHENNLFQPDTDGVGEVWVNTQFEKTINKNHLGTSTDKPGTITIVDAKTWDIERKVSLPEINMNHPHNMWANAEQDIVYQTQWFDSRMAAIERESGELIKDVFVGQSPSHVMTAPSGENEGKIYIAMNGEEQVTELDATTLDVTRQFSTGPASHPHGHWISTDGTIMVTPNFFTSESTIVNLENPSLTENVKVGLTPIAVGMMPDGSKYFTADFLGNTLSVVDLTTDPIEVRSIDLFNHGFPDVDPQGIPVQTPTSPDGKWVVTATVLNHQIMVVDANAEELVAIISCDPGCHGVQWGAKEGGGYYAYVSNKFSNALLVVDPEPEDKMPGFDAEVVGKILLTKQSDTELDDRIIGYAGMGGQGVLAVPNVYDGWIQQTVDACGTGNCSDEIEDFLIALEPEHKFESE
jgi:FtsP/CotA-like multicopper oxidase with cupredoxin domain